MSETYALTMEQPFATLAIEGAMQYWHSRTPVSPRLVGERIVIFAGARCAPGDIILLYENLVFEGGFGSTLDAGKAAHTIAMIRAGDEGSGPKVKLPEAAALGTAVIGRSVTLTSLFPPDPQIRTDVWASPLTDIVPFAKPVRGISSYDKGFWRWPLKVAA